MRYACLAQPKKSSAWCFVLDIGLCFFPSVWDARFIFRLCLRRLCDCWFRMQATSALVFSSTVLASVQREQRRVGFSPCFRKSYDSNKHARPARDDAGKAALAVQLTRDGSMTVLHTTKATHAVYASPDTVTSVRPPSFFCSTS